MRADNVRHERPSLSSRALPVAYQARWIFPVGAPPLRQGLLEVDASGRVASIRAGRDREAHDLGEVAIVPALVNAHVHLEFSDLATPIAPAHPFPQWVKQIVAHRRGRREPVRAIIQRGLNEARRGGTIALGEIATADDLAPYDADASDVTVFRELIGPLPDQWPQLLATAEHHLSSGNRQCGLSPHAPYTVPQELLEHVVALAVRHNAPLCAHLAEIPAERELLAQGRGELVEMMSSLGLWRPQLHPRGRRPLDWLQTMASAPRTLVVHGNDLDEDELEFLAAHEHLSLIYCPRTHAYFRHAPHPFLRLLQRGGRVALATDGRSSNPDLDVWAEAQFVRARHPHLPCATILDLITRSPAEALGLGERHGCLAVGREANFLAVRVEGQDGNEPPELFGKTNRITAVFHRGIPLTESIS